MKGFEGVQLRFFVAYFDAIILYNDINYAYDRMCDTK